MRNADKLRIIIDRINTIRRLLDLPIPAHMHLNAVKLELNELSNELKSIYIEEEKNNPWEELYEKDID